MEFETAPELDSDEAKRVKFILLKQNQMKVKQNIPTNLRVCDANINECCILTNTLSKNVTFVKGKVKVNMVLTVPSEAINVELQW